VIGAGGERASVAAGPTSARPSDPGDGVTLLGALGIALGAGVIATLFTTALRRRRGETRPAEG
jgi:hypothetical protein